MYSAHSSKAGTYIFVYFKWNLNTFKGDNSIKTACFNSENESTLKGKKLRPFGVFGPLGNNPLLLEKIPFDKGFYAQESRQ